MLPIRLRQIQLAQRIILWGLEPMPWRELGPTFIFIRYLNIRLDKHLKLHGIVRPNAQASLQSSAGFKC